MNPEFTQINPNIYKAPQDIEARRVDWKSEIAADPTATKDVLAASLNTWTNIEGKPLSLDQLVENGRLSDTGKAFCKDFFNTLYTGDFDQGRGSIDALTSAFKEQRLAQQSQILELTQKINSLSEGSKLRELKLLQKEHLINKFKQENVAAQRIVSSLNIRLCNENKKLKAADIQADPSRLILPDLPENDADFSELLGKIETGNPVAVFDRVLDHWTEEHKKRTGQEISREALIESLIDKDGKFTPEGRSMAKTLYRVINFGGPLRVSAGIDRFKASVQDRFSRSQELQTLESEIGQLEQKVKELSPDGKSYDLISRSIRLRRSLLEKKQTEYRGLNYKTNNAHDSEKTFFRNTALSMERQVRQNVSVGAMEDIKYGLDNEDGRNHSWGSVLSSYKEKSQSDVSSPETKKLPNDPFLENVLALKIADTRVKILKEIHERTRGSASDILRGKSESEVLNLMRHAERMFLLKKFDQIDHASLAASVDQIFLETDDEGKKSYDAFIDHMYQMSTNELNYLDPSDLPGKKAILDALRRRGAPSDKGPSTRLKVFNGVRLTMIAGGLASTALGLGGSGGMDIIKKDLDLGYQFTESAFTHVVQVGSDVYNHFSQHEGLAFYDDPPHTDPVHHAGPIYSELALSEEDPSLAHHKPEPELKPVAHAVVTEPEEKTEMKPLPDQKIVDKCLRPVAKNGGTVLEYNTANADDIECKENFPGMDISLDAPEKYSTVVEYEIDLNGTMLNGKPLKDSLPPFIAERGFRLYTQTGETCALTTIMDIINNSKPGPRFHPWVASDLFQEETLHSEIHRGASNSTPVPSSDTKADSLLSDAQKEKIRLLSLSDAERSHLALTKEGRSELISTLNTFKIDSRGLRDMYGIGFKEESFKEFFGSDEKNRNEYIRTHSDEIAQKIYDLYKGKLANGELTTFLADVATHADGSRGGHSMIVLGVAKDEKTGVLELIAGETNWGWVGWDLTQKAGWKSLPNPKGYDGRSGIITIPLNTDTLIMASTWGTLSSFKHIENDTQFVNHNMPEDVVMPINTLVVENSDGSLSTRFLN